MVVAISVFRNLLPQLVPTLLGTLMATSDGMTYGWTSPMVPYFMSNETHIDITQNDAEWMETINLLGYIAGLPFTILSVSYLGRKICMTLSSALGCVCWILLMIAVNVKILYVARFFAGVAGNMCFVAVPMYIAEISDYRIRGFLSSFVYLMMIIGILIVYISGAVAPYWVTHAIGILLTACQTIFVPFLPESPYYFIYKNQPEKAKKALARLRTDQNIDDELEEIKKEVEREKSIQSRPMDLITIKSNRIALCISLIVNGTQHFVGTSVFLMNLQPILEEAGSVYIETSTASILFAVISLTSISLGSTVIDRYGRKILLIFSSITTGIALLAITIFFHLQYLGYDVASVSWIPAASAMVYAATFTVGLGLVPLVLIPEIFPTTVKALGMTLANLFYMVGAVAAINFYQVLFHNYGLHVPLYIFTFFSFAMAIFTVLWIPETKGKTLDEIQLRLKGEKPEKVAKSNGNLKTIS